MPFIVRIKRKKLVPSSSMEETSTENYYSAKSCSDGEEKSSPFTSDVQRYSPSTSDVQRNSPSTSDVQRNSPSTSDVQRNSPSTCTSDGDGRNSPCITDSDGRDSPSKDRLRINGLRWSTKKRRGRKSTSSSSSSDACLSDIDQKQKEPVFGEKELVDALMHLWKLSERYELENSKKERVRKLKKKRKLQDIEDRLKKPRIENCSDTKIILQKTKSEAINQLASTFECGNCKKSFSCYQALGGHKSTCNSNYGKIEVGESSLQGAMRKKNNKIDESYKEFGSSGVHECKVCREKFSSGQALGGHQRKHTYKSAVSPPNNISVNSLVPTNALTSVQEEQESAVSPPNNISADSLVPIPTNSLASVQEEEDDTANKKTIFMFDLNEPAPEEEDATEL